MIGIQREQAEAPRRKSSSSSPRSTARSAGPRNCRGRTPPRSAPLRRAAAVAAGAGHHGACPIDASGHEQLLVSRLTMDVTAAASTIDQAGIHLGRGAQGLSRAGLFRRESEPYDAVARRHAARYRGGIAQVNLKPIWDVVSKIRSASAAAPMWSMPMAASSRTRYQPGVAEYRYVEAGAGPQRPFGRFGAGGAGSRGDHRHPGADRLCACRRRSGCWCSSKRRSPKPMRRFTRHPAHGYVLFGELCSPHRRHVPGQTNGRRDRGVARGRGADSVRPSQPAHQHRDRRRSRGARPTS